MTANPTNQSSSNTTLIKLVDSSIVLDEPADDLRGRNVIDSGGEEIGSVSALFVDQDNQKVRFLEISAGGFLGMGKRHFLLPVDAVTRVQGNEVHISKERTDVTGAPPYDPELHTATDRDFLQPVYGYYGMMPYWGAGYMPSRYARF